MAFKASQAACVVDSQVMRRSLIFVLALSMVGLGLGSLSACALFSSKLAECATPKTQPQCEQMNIGESGTQLVPASDTSCCSISQAPIPQSQYKASGLSRVVPIAALDPTGDTPRFQGVPPVLIVQDLSPPSVQTLLCTFLI